MRKRAVRVEVVAVHQSPARAPPVLEGVGAVEEEELVVDVVRPDRLPLVVLVHCTHLPALRVTIPVEAHEERWVVCHEDGAARDELCRKGAETKILACPFSSFDLGDSSEEHGHGLVIS